MKTLAAIVLGALAAWSVSAAKFEVEGTVRQLRPATQSVVVEHEDIPGFMPAMTMPFKVQDAKELEGLSSGARVAFTFVVGDSQSYAEGFRVIGQASAPEATAAQGESVKKVREGDAVPQVQLVNQHGAEVGLADEQGRWTLMTFIFTRCPVPEFCPLMNRNFIGIQSQLDAALASKTRFLSVTLDPEFDTPERLKSYGEAYGADFGQWEFATGSTEQIDTLTEAFRVYVKQNGVTLDHTLCTALVAPDGTIEKIWRGNFWKPEDVVAALDMATSSQVTAVVE